MNNSSLNEPKKRQNTNQPTSGWKPKTREKFSRLRKRPQKKSRKLSQTSGNIRSSGAF